LDAQASHALWNGESPGGAIVHLAAGVHDLEPRQSTALGRDGTIVLEGTVRVKADLPRGNIDSADVYEHSSSF